MRSCELRRRAREKRDACFFFSLSRVLMTCPVGQVIRIQRVALELLRKRGATRTTCDEHLFFSLLRSNEISSHTFLPHTLTGGWARSLERRKKSVSLSLFFPTSRIQICSSPLLISALGSGNDIRQQSKGGRPRISCLIARA